MTKEPPVRCLHPGTTTDDEGVTRCLYCGIVVEVVHGRSE